MFVLLDAQLRWALSHGDISVRCRMCGSAGFDPMSFYFHLTDQHDMFMAEIDYAAGAYPTASPESRS